MQTDQVRPGQFHEIPIDKPIRKGGYVANRIGERCWVTFRYERLPIFCYNFGKHGLNQKHCPSGSPKQRFDRKYGEWLKAGGTVKNGSEKARATSNISWESMGTEDTRVDSQPEVETLSQLGRADSGKNDGQAGSQSLKGGNVGKEIGIGTSNPLILCNQSRRDNLEKPGRNSKAK
ncbi:hypothetical protein ACB094_01G167700 [Castanea mollissima]